MYTYKKFILSLTYIGMFILSHSVLVAQKKIARPRISNNSSTVVAYPAIDSLITSPDFQVTVNNKHIWTESLGDGGLENLNVANYSCSGKQVITITASVNIIKYKIRPKSRNIVGRVSGRELTFTISGPQKLYIEINKLPHLAIFANPLETNVPKKDDVGIIYYAPGSYNVGTINLQSNQMIYIAGGAVLNANIRGINVQHVKIFGRGILNGNVRISASSNLDVNGIFIRNTQGWCNTITDCHHTIYDNVKVFSYKTVWGVDGIDPVSCKDFLINDCFIRTRDDCVSIKSEIGNPRFPVKDINTDSISVLNCLLVGWQHADGVTLGFELQGGSVQNVLVKNCDILSARGQGRTGGHAALSIVCDGPSEVKNVRFDNIRVENEIEYKNLELIITEGRRYGTAGPGHIAGVYLKNIHWANRDKPFVIAGIPTNFVTNVTFDNCYLAGKLLTNLSDADFQMEFSRDVKFKSEKTKANH
ncbi:MAG: glycosyl hydrolase family 28 protein [Bacteroidota bacterium]|nr:glycosyl hydrolase family 28 protein [Bacteroidota bacterium]